TRRTNLAPFAAPNPLHAPSVREPSGVEPRRRGPREAQTGPRPRLLGDPVGAVVAGARLDSDCCRVLRRGFLDRAVADRAAARARGPALRAAAAVCDLRRAAVPVSAAAGDGWPAPARPRNRAVTPAGDRGCRRARNGSR